ncbi:MAG: recombinase RecA [Candidatus Riflebacteria bacterium]|nr:recombinase RecA [Candidatus Riflebacteria bacterium]
MADYGKSSRTNPSDPTKDPKKETHEGRKEATPAPGPEKHPSGRAETPGDTAEGKEQRDAKNKVLEATLTQISKQFGKGAIMRLGKAYADMSVQAIPTGALTLDLALGIGGIPRGRVSEIYGPESSGKTTLALHIISQAQRRGGTAAFIDVEHALDPEYAARLGVNTDELLVSQPNTGEEALEIVDMLIRSSALDVIVVDSVAALVPRAELEGEMGDSHMGLQARLMSQALRKITGSISKSRTACIFINQIRMKIGVMFGNPETTTGGNALKLYPNVRLDIRRIEAIKEGEATVGSRVRVKVAKNKLAPPFKQAEFDILFGSGISREGNILDLALEHNLIEKSGAWFSYGDQRIGQGRENARQFLAEHAELAKELEEKLVAQHMKKRKEAQEEGVRRVN